MNEDEPKWLEINIGKDSKFVRYSDVITVTYENDKIFVLTGACKVYEARELYLCDFFGRRQSRFSR